MKNNKKLFSRKVMIPSLINTPSSTPLWTFNMHVSMEVAIAFQKQHFKTASTDLYQGR